MNNRARYRLRAFEFSFVEPVLEHLFENPEQEQKLVDSMIWNLLLRGSNDSVWEEHPYGCSHGIVRACILAEASEWIRWGTQIGYFSSEIRPEPLIIGGLDFHKSPMAINFLSDHVRPERDYEISHRDFGRELNMAIESLDAERTELLRLLHFSSSAEWYFSLSRINVFVSKLALGQAISGAEIDGVSWAFLDFSEEFPPSGTPRDWRSLLLRASAWQPRLRQLLAAGAALVAAAAISDPTETSQETSTEDVDERRGTVRPPKPSSA